MTSDLESNKSKPEIWTEHWSFFWLVSHLLTALQLIGNKEVASIFHEHRFHDVLSIHKLQISLWGDTGITTVQNIQMHCEGKCSF